MKVKFKKKLKTKMKIKQKVIKNLNAPTEILSKYMTFKNNIKNICINKSVLNILNDICYRTNCIVRNTYYFIRHFYAYCFENKIEFPKIDHKMIRDIYALVSYKTKKEVIKENPLLTKFHDNIFSKLEFEIVSRDNLTQNLTYETERIIVNIETNIREHFKEHFNRYIKVTFEYYDKENAIKKLYQGDDLKRELINIRGQYNNIKSNIAFIHEPIIEEHFDFINKQRNKLFKLHNLIQKNVFYDVQCNPLNYLYTFYAIVNTYEKRNFIHNIHQDVRYNNVMNNLNNEKITNINKLTNRNLLHSQEIFIEKVSKKNKFTKFNDRIKQINDHNDKICHINKLYNYNLQSNLDIFVENKTPRWKKNKIKLFNVTPLQTTLIPKYITIDTMTIIQNFKDLIKQNIDVFSDPIIVNVESLRRNFNNEQTKYELWSLLFNMENSYFNKKGNYKFNYMLTTDCVSCSTLFLHKDCHTIKKGRTIGTKSKIKIKNDVQYVEHKIIKEELNLNKQIVCIDPNKRDAIYCGTFPDNNETLGLKRFRYTTCQRRKEMKTKKYSKIRKDSFQINVQEFESQKVIDKRTVNVNTLCKYITNCSKIDKQIKHEYEKPLHRKLKWYAFLNKRKSELRMIKNFKKKMGNNKNTIVVIGDYSCKLKNIKGSLHAIAKQIIDIFRKSQYETYIIDEYNTSKVCNKCGSDMETFMRRMSPKPKQKDKEIIVHGLLRCTSVTQNCKAIHNRDTNAVLNMLKIVKQTKENLKRPLRYCQIINKNKTTIYPGKFTLSIPSQINGV